MTSYWIFIFLQRIYSFFYNFYTKKTTMAQTLYFNTEIVPNVCQMCVPSVVRIRRQTRKILHKSFNKVRRDYEQTADIFVTMRLTCFIRGVDERMYNFIVHRGRGIPFFDSVKTLMRCCE
jgi:hypothetical protein